MTPHQLRIARMAGIDGLTNKQIGERLRISVQTVKVHLCAIFKEKGVHRRFDLGTVLRREELTKQCSISKELGKP